MEPNSKLLLRAAALRPLAVRNYAVSRQWKIVSNTKGRIWVYRHSQHQLRQLQIPIDTDIGGYDEAMFDVIQRLADVEGRDVSSVMDDLNHPDADTLRFIVESPESRSGDLPLIDDLRLREGARRAIMAAALLIKKPARHHARLWMGEADQLLRSCLAGQTEVGSYVVKIICPLDAAEDDQVVIGTDEEPLVRRATRLLMETTASLATGIEQNSLDTLLKEGDEVPRLSWNLCDALLRMQPSQSGKLNLGVTWAASPDLPIPVDTPTRVSLPADYFPVLERIATRLRPKPASTKPSFFIGTVERLEGAIGDDGRRAGDVVLKVFDDDGEAVEARADLNADYYALAHGAHLNGPGYVKLTGVLRRGVRMSRIERLQDFAVVEHDASAV